MAEKTRAETLLGFVDKVNKQAALIDWEDAKVTEAAVVEKIHDGIAKLVTEKLPPRGPGWVAPQDVHRLMEQMLRSLQAAESLLVKSEAVTAGLLKERKLGVLQKPAAEALRREQVTRLKELAAVQAWVERRRCEAVAFSALQRFNAAQVAVNEDASLQGRPNRPALLDVLRRRNAERAMADAAVKLSKQRVAELPENESEPEPPRDFSIALSQVVLPMLQESPDKTGAAKRPAGDVSVSAVEVELDDLLGKQQRVARQEKVAVAPKPAAPAAAAEASVTNAADDDDDDEAQQRRLREKEAQEAQEAKKKEQEEQKEEQEAKKKELEERAKQDKKAFRDAAKKLLAVRPPIPSLRTTLACMRLRPARLTQRTLAPRWRSRPSVAGRRRWTFSPARMARWRTATRCSATSSRPQRP